jgi:hypothetical protein
MNEMDKRSKSRQFTGVSTATSPKRPRKFITEREVASFMRAESLMSHGGASTNVQSINGTLSPKHLGNTNPHV